MDVVPRETFHLGPDWTGTLTVTRRGEQPWVQQISHATPSGDATLGRYTDALVCPRDDPDPTVLVDTWSKFKGKLKVGRRAPVGEELLGHHRADRVQPGVLGPPVQVPSR